MDAMKGVVEHYRNNGNLARPDHVHVQYSFVYVFQGNWKSCSSFACVVVFAAWSIFKQLVCWQFRERSPGWFCFFAVSLLTTLLRYEVYVGHGGSGGGWNCKWCWEEGGIRFCSPGPALPALSVPREYHHTRYYHPTAFHSCQGTAYPNGAVREAVLKNGRPRERGLWPLAWNKSLRPAAVGGTGHSSGAATTWGNQKATLQQDNRRDYCWSSRDLSWLERHLRPLEWATSIRKSCRLSQPFT